MKKGTVKRVVSVIMAVILLLCPLSFAFADQEEEIIDLQQQQEINDYTMTWITWYVLHAWGIEISFEDYQEFTSETSDWLLQQTLEFVDTLPSVSSIYQWTSGWLYSRDTWGNFQGNQTLLEDLQDFADWLVAKFNLTTNPSQVIGYGSYLEFANGVRAYPIKSKNYNTGYGIYNIILDDSTDNALCYMCTFNDESNRQPYVIFIDYGNGSIGELYFSTTNYLLQYRYINKIPGQPGDGTRSQSAMRFDSHNARIFSNNERDFVDVSPWYCYSHYATSTRFQPYNNKYSPNMVAAAFGYTTPPITTSSDIAIDSTDILLPDDDPNYTSGDSIKITFDGPLYVELEWDGTVSVDNLPAIVSTGNVRDPGLSDVFLPLKGFINTFSNGFRLMTQIVYNLPTPVVGMALAIMSAIAVFGVIRILKEH